MTNRLITTAEATTLLDQLGGLCDVREIAARAASDPNRDAVLAECVTYRDTLTLVRGVIERHYPVHPRVVSAGVTPWCARCGPIYPYPCKDRLAALDWVTKTATAKGLLE